MPEPVFGLRRAPLRRQIRARDQPHGALSMTPSRASRQAPQSPAARRQGPAVHAGSSRPSRGIRHGPHLVPSPIPTARPSLHPPPQPSRRSRCCSLPACAWQLRRSLRLHSFTRDASRHGPVRSAPPGPKAPPRRRVRLAYPAAASRRPVFASRASTASPVCAPGPPFACRLA